MTDHRKILITGGGGMLAHAFGSVLRAKGVEPVMLERARFDLTDIAQMIKVLDREKPSVVINCAAYTKVDQAEVDTDLAMNVNAKSVGGLAEACRKREITLVHFSTDYVFDGSLKRPLKIDDPVGPTSAYGVTKLLGERMLKEFAPKQYLILRTAWLYGPGGPNFPQAMLNAARAGKPLKVINDQFGCPTFTFDLAAATLDLLEAHASGTFHLSNTGQTNWFDFASAIMQTFGVTPVSLEPITSENWKKLKPTSANRPSYSVLDTTDYTRVTGKFLPDWHDALLRYCAMTS